MQCQQVNLRQDHNILAQKVVHAVVLHHATTNPSSRPNRGPPASAAHRYIEPAAGEAEQTSAMTAAVMKVKTMVTR